MTNKQTILITGATGNIGGGAALALAKRGARVVLLGRRLETIQARVDSIRVALSEARIECQDTDIATLVVVAYRSIFDYKRALSTKGIYVMVGGSI